VGFTIGDYEIRTDTCEVLYKGAPQKIEPQVFKLLTYMLENPDRVLSRDELINKVWKSRIVSDSALSATVCAARQAIGDTGSKQSCIKTVSGSGYRFIATFTHVENYTKNNTKISARNRVQSDLTTKLKGDVFTEAQTEQEQKPKSLQLPDKPSVAIMDFKDIGTNQEGALLAYGLTTEINSAIARLPHFFVIARASASIASKLNLQPKEIGKRLGVRYLVYGNLEQLGKRIRITFSIIDAIHDTEIWSDHFDRSLDDLFLIQDDISTAIVSATDSVIEQAEIERVFQIPTEDLSAWENYHRGKSYSDRTNLKDVEIAHGFFKKAVKQDPRFSRGYALLSYTHTNRRLLNHTVIKETDADMIKAFDYAQRSIDYCAHESMGYMSLGRATLFTNKVAQALPILDQSIHFCPNGATSLLLKAQATIRLGAENSTLINETLDQSKRLNPHCRIANFNIYMVRAMAMFQQKKYEQANHFITRTLHYNDSYYLAYVLAAICQQLAGNAEQAQNYALKALSLLPHCSLDSCERLLPEAKEPRAILIKAILDIGIPQGDVLKH